MGLEIASPEMIRSHIDSNFDRQRMREISAKMHKNEFFKEFVAKYNKGLSRALQVVMSANNSSEESDAGPKQNPKQSPSTSKDAKGGAAKSKSVQPKKCKPANYGKLLMNHCNNTNQYRKQLPGMFSKDKQNNMSTLLTEKLKSLQPVSMPKSVMRIEEQEGNVALSRSPRNNRSQRSLEAHDVAAETAEMAQGAAGMRFGAKRRSHQVEESAKVKEQRAGLFQDEDYMRRLKQKNYGKWYMKPKQFGNKIKLLNNELERIKEMNN